MTHLYRHFNQGGVLLYVGVSLHGPNRLGRHNRSRWFREIAIVTFEKFETKKQALFAEACAILKEQPLFNIRGKGQKCTINGKRIPLIPNRKQIKPFFSSRSSAIKSVKKRDWARMLERNGKPQTLKELRRMFASVGGRSRSNAKRAAARINGAKGGRPRKATK